MLGLPPGALAAEYIPEGVTIEGIPIGGIKPKTAREILPQLIPDYRFTLHDRTLDVPLSKLGIKPKIDEAVYQAAYVQAPADGLDIKLNYQYKPQEVFKKLSQLLAEEKVAPVNARVAVREQGKISVIPAVYGKRPDLHASFKRMEIALRERTLVSKVYYLPVEPEWAAAAVEQIKPETVIARYTTYFNPRDKGRTANLKLASAAVDGTMILPGEVFSFNGVVGVRSEEKGYQEAKVVVNGEFVPGLGGGICQVSTTLYNAVLRAGFPIKERRKHSLPVKYVPLGLDATVVYGSVDFKFINDLSTILLIKAGITGNQLYIKIYGPQKFYRPTRLVREVTPHQTKPGDKSKLPGGNHVKVYRLFLEKGQPDRQEFISRDYYPPDPPPESAGSADQTSAKTSKIGE